MEVLSVLLQGFQRRLDPKILTLSVYGKIKTKSSYLLL